MPTLRDLCDLYLAETRLDHAPSTHYQRHIFCLTILHDLLPLSMEGLTPDRLRQWKGMLAQRYAPGTVNQYMGRLQVILAAGVEYGWLSEQPLAHIRKPTPGRGRTRFLSPEERDRLLDACRCSRNSLLYPIVVMALSTGGRKDELRYLHWSAVDFDAGAIRFLETKSDRARSVPLMGEARSLLMEMARSHLPCCSWVFHHRKACKPINMETAWRGARSRAQLQDFHFHDLRHTYASYLAMSGATLREIADLLGHVNIQMTMRYAHLLPSHTRGVVERMWHKFLETPHMP